MLSALTWELGGQIGSSILQPMFVWDLRELASHTSNKDWAVVLSCHLTQELLTSLLQRIQLGMHLPNLSSACKYTVVAVDCNT